MYTFLILALRVRVGKETSIDFFSRYVREGACANASKNGFAAARVFITFIESGFFFVPSQVHIQCA